MFIHTLTDFSSSSCKWIAFCEMMMPLSRKSYASLLVLPSRFARSTRDFESQTIYISTHCLTCSHDHENIFERCRLLNPDLRNIKTMKHLSYIHMKSTIDNERWIALSKFYSTHNHKQTERQWSPMSHSTRSSSEQERKRRKSDESSRKKERFRLIWRDIKTVTLNQPITGPTVVWS